MTSVTPFLMFERGAEEAATFYVSVIPNSRTVHIERYGPNGPGPEGAVMMAAIELAGRLYHFMDSPTPHGFGFTPAMSLFVECESEAEIDRCYAALSEGGQIMMPLSAYEFSPKFGWVADRWGVSWQLTLPPTP